MKDRNRAFVSPVAWHDLEKQGNSSAIKRHRNLLPADAVEEGKLHKESNLYHKNCSVQELNASPQVRARVNARPVMALLNEVT